MREIEFFRFNVFRFHVHALKHRAYETLNNFLSDMQYLHVRYIAIVSIEVFIKFIRSINNIHSDILSWLILGY